MTYDVRISEQADSDIRGIYEYIAYELLSPENALGQLNRLEENISKLDTMPKRFSAYEREPWFSRGLRAMPVDNFMVYYIPDEMNHIVTVIRVMYDGRNADEELACNTLYKNNNF